MSIGIKDYFEKVLENGKLDKSLIIAIEALSKISKIDRFSASGNTAKEALSQIERVYSEETVGVQS